MKIFKSDKIKYSISFNLNKSKSEVIETIQERIRTNKTRKYPFYILNRVEYSRFAIENEKISIKGGVSLDHIDIYIQDIPGGKSILKFERPKSFPMRIFMTITSTVVFAFLLFVHKGSFDIVSIIVELVAGLLVILIIWLFLYLDETMDKYKVKRYAKLIVRDLN